jgi:hypothetical protein
LSRFWFYLLYHYYWLLVKNLVQILKYVSIYYKVHSLIDMNCVIFNFVSCLPNRHLDIKMNVFNRSSCLVPLLNPNIILFSFKLTVPTFKVFIKIVMFDMNRLVIMHLKNKCWYVCKCYMLKLSKNAYID